ncbi:P63C domain-containing protein [Streptoalloteichus hindustanus]|uniref:p63C domain-containing protein n=1 Tax=Streptoalloteichus hindustanus TaxID=2017 RepID=A0A1M5BVE1_STRHI|nr:P63C domain-containing protein [Streptoalloteichus hindustanus]SHF46321.1 P63C domain-containing protein [Streptoalloteichus hindustanus]
MQDERLDASDHSAIARREAPARWGDDVKQATHAGDFQIGDRVITCAVLDDGTRLVSQATLLASLGRNPRAKTNNGETILFAANLIPYLKPEVVQELSEPIQYRSPQGRKASGYRALLLPEICEAYLRARADGKLTPNQLTAAQAAEVLVRGLARVGIVALVDEATGYQEVRARQELQKILEAYVQAELRSWLKTFPDEFFKEIYRLQGWEYKPGTSKRTPYVGKLINKYIYEALPEGVLEELQRKNPRTEKGYRRYRHFQFLSADTGHPHLDKQISTVTTLMRISKTKLEFEELFERAFPPMQPKLSIVIDDNGDHD